MQFPLCARLGALLLATLLGACGGGSDDDAPAPVAAPPAAGTLGDSRLPELLTWARDSQNVPAMGAIVIRNGVVAERAVVGVRSNEASVAVTVDDRWHLGSLTKSMTATLAAVLVEGGLISWDTTVREVWPELEPDMDARFRNATLRQFLSHTTGMRRDDNFAGASDAAPGTDAEKRRQWVARLLAGEPSSTPGMHSYSNVGYVVAGAMLETRAQSDFETLLSSRVFAPLGMTRSGFGAPGSGTLTTEPWGHRADGSSFDAVAPGGDSDNFATLAPAGTVHATLDDYARYLSAHLAGARGIPSLISAASFSTLHTAVAPDYALGWGIQASLTPLSGGGLAHAGSNLRWFALTWFSTSHDVGLLVVTNGGGPRAEAAVVALERLLRARVAASL